MNSWHVQKANPGYVVVYGPEPHDHATARGRRFATRHYAERLRDELARMLTPEQSEDEADLWLLA